MGLTKCTNTQCQLRDECLRSSITGESIYEANFQFINTKLFGEEIIKCNYQIKK